VCAWVCVGVRARMREREKWVDYVCLHASDEIKNSKQTRDI